MLISTFFLVHDDTMVLGDKGGKHSSCESSEVKPLNYSIAKIKGQDTVHSSGKFYSYLSPKKPAPNN